MQTIRWGIIGCGDIVMRRVGPALMSIADCEIAAVTRSNPDRLEACRDALKAGRGFSDWQELVRDEGVDAVYIATPVRLHSEQVLAALAYGKHVLCEKPLGLNQEECQEVLTASRNNSVRLGVAYYRRYYPVVRRLKEIIDAGEIGDVILASAEASETFLPAVDHPRRWILEKNQAGGGSLMDFGCHRIEVMLHLLGKEIAAGGVWGQAYAGHDVEDTATVAIQFESGANGVVTVTRGGTVARDALRIQGTRGMLQVDNLNGGWMTVSGEGGTRQETLPCHDNPHLPLIEAFCRSIQETSLPDIGAEMGWRVQRIIDSVYRNHPFSNG